jgi:hypothetical protein
MYASRSRRLCLLAACFLAASGAASAAPADFILRHGIEPCPPAPISRSAARTLLASQLDAEVFCVPPQVSAITGGTVSVCHTPACPGEMHGCPIALVIESVDDAFPPGRAEFELGGTAQPFSVPILIQALVTSSCTLHLSGLNFLSGVGFAAGVDNDEGLYLRVRDQSDFDIVSYELAGCDSLMPILAPLLPFVEVQIASSAADGVGQRADALLGETICPLGIAD